MRWQDIRLLGKKILVGVALVLVPLGILYGGLRTTQHLLPIHSQAQSSLHSR